MQFFFKKKKEKRTYPCKELISILGLYVIKSWGEKHFLLYNFPNKIQSNKKKIPNKIMQKKEFTYDNIEKRYLTKAS